VFTWICPACGQLIRDRRAVLMPAADERGMQSTAGGWSPRWRVPLAYDEELDAHGRALLTLLREQSPGQQWWLGYLDTGVDD
jgi:hypothetical protein